MEDETMTEKSNLIGLAREYLLLAAAFIELVTAVVVLASKVVNYVRPISEFRIFVLKE
jgi:hypothetical protein